MFNTKKTSFETTSASTINTIIGDKSKIIGTLTASEHTRVDGVLEGKILSESAVIIGEHGSINGDIEGHDILIAGVVNGNIHASERIRITSTGRVFGRMSRRKCPQSSHFRTTANNGTTLAMNHIGTRSRPSRKKPLPFKRKITRGLNVHEMGKI